ncbi:hypothetical protein K7432_003618 [Basidiobolus ranarum]
MKKRGWKVGILREFFPKNPNLLGLNKNYGQEICIRLRPSSNDSQFLPYESLLGTLLHELTHIIRGPHDQQFYKILDELTTECENLMVKGFTGEGFYGIGHRVGQGISHNLPPHISRGVAVEAAEKRQQINKILGPAGGRKLGGKSVSKNLEKLYSPRMLAAMAAERRAQDNIWCAGNVESVEIYEEPKPQSNTNTIDDSKPLEMNKPKAAIIKIPSSSGVTKSTQSDTLPKRDPQVYSKSSHHDSEQQIILGKRSRETSDEWVSWTCPTCTLVNLPLVLACGCCLTERPSDQDLTSVTKLSKVTREWSCPQCTLLNAPDTPKCQICEFVVPV